MRRSPDRSPRERPGAPGTRRGPGRLRAVVVALLVALPLLVAVGAAPAGAATACAGTPPAGQIRVVLVVDPGDTGPRGPQATCLVVPAGTSGAQLLAQRAALLGLPGPRYAGSGLLCGIDGFPGSGCPTGSSGGTYDYWAYFNGVGGQWSYGHDNPFARRSGDGEIVGWRYTVDSSDGQAAPPRIAPSASLFPPLTPVTQAPPPPVVAPPAPAPSGGGATGATGSGGTGSAGAAGPGAGSSVDGTGGAAPAPGGAGAAPTDPTATTPDGAPLDPAAPGDPAATTTVPGSSTTVAGEDGSGATGAEELAAAPTSSSSSDAGRWVGLVVAVVVAAALGIGAVVRTRGRARP